jgi:hypothetical protein
MTISMHHRIIGGEGKRLKDPKQTTSMGSGFVSSEFPVSIRPKIDNKQVILAVAYMGCMENGLPECNAAQTQSLTASHLHTDRVKVQMQQPRGER